MRKRFTIIFILLNMIVNFFVFPVFADDDPCGEGQYFDDYSNSCLADPSYTPDTSGDSEVITTINDNYYTKDNIRCKVRVTVNHDIEEVISCWTVDDEGNKIAEVSLVEPDELQFINKKKFEAPDGTTYHPLTADVEELFDFNLKQDLSRPLDWLMDRKTYIVVKEVKSGEKAVFWNVPNVQQQLVNNLLSKIINNSGYTENVYDPETRLVEVGNDTNYMTKYGFNIPNIEYNGEISFVLMSLNRILPTNWWSAAWRVFKSTFGNSSFLDAPDVTNYASMQYFGNTYDEDYDTVIDFIAKNWYTYFVDKLYIDTRDQVNDKGDYPCNPDVHTFCDFTTTNKDFEFKEQGKKIGKNYYIYGTISQMYVAPQNKESSVEWIQNYFYKLQTEDSHFAFIVDENIDKSSNKFGKTNNVGEKETKYKLDMKVTAHDVAVEDFKTFNDELEKLVKFDREQAMIIADNRCRFTLSSTNEVTDAGEGRDGLEDWHPDNYKDEYTRNINGTVEVDDGNCDDEGGTSTLKCPTYCRLDDNAGYKYLGDYDVASRPSSCSDTGFDEISYNRDVNYWESGSGGHSDIYHGRNQIVNSVNACVEQYEEIYDKCVDYNTKHEGLEEKKKICSLYQKYKYAVPTYTDEKGNIMYNTDKRGVNYRYVTNSRESFFFDSHYIYYFENNFNFLNSYPEAGNRSHIEFNKGYQRMKFFNSDYMTAQKANGAEVDNKRYTFPNVELVKSIVGIDAQHHNKVEGGYALNVETIAKFRLYNDHWENSFKKAKEKDDYIYYNQCLIDTATANQCLTEDDNQLYLKNIFADNGVAEIEMNVNSVKWKLEKEKLLEERRAIKPEFDIKDEELLRQKAELIVSKIQSSSAQYYDTVMNHIIQLMIDKSDGAIEFEDSVPSRVMPYSLNAMVPVDQDRVRIADPRYESSRIQKLIDGDLSGLTAGESTKKDAANGLLTVIGYISELSVMLTQFMNFTYIEKTLKLSPVTMWSGFLMQILIGGLVTWFIFRMVVLAWKFIHGNAGIREVIVRFIMFLMLLGFLVVTSIAPNNTWNLIKRATDLATTLAEQTALKGNSNYDKLIKGDTSGEIVYWAPYFDAWSLYNTGYSIVEPEQSIDFNDGTPETKNFSSSEELWSLVLVDSFVNKHNGTLNIHNKAYRVVDHFMAPRVKIESNNAITVTQNKNYNGMYQRNVLGLIPKVFGIFLILLIVIVKFLTFLYLWYMVYTLMINILISLNTEGDIRNLLKQTFMPIPQLFFLGLWSAICIYITSLSNDLASTVIIIGLYYVSWQLFKMWKEKFGYFPQTLLPLYSLPMSITNMYHRIKGVLS